MDPDHLGWKLLRHLEWRLVDPIVDLKQPTSRALIQSMDPITQNQLGHGDHDHLGVPLRSSAAAASSSRSWVTLLAALGRATGLMAYVLVAGSPRV
jgi:hypothetical protein